jgi:hypothetical protein
MHSTKLDARRTPRSVSRTSANACFPAVEALEEALGVAIEGLPREALLPGSSGDVAVGPVEDGGGIGDAGLGG